MGARANNLRARVQSAGGLSFLNLPSELGEAAGAVAQGVAKHFFAREGPLDFRGVEKLYACLRCATQDIDHLGATRGIGIGVRSH